MKAWKYASYAICIVFFLTLLIYGGSIVYRHNGSLEEAEKLLAELDQIKANRLNTFIDADITVYVDDVPVNEVTAEIVGDAESIRVGDDNYGIEPLLEDGYVMLVNGVLELTEGATLDSVLAYYYPYEVKIEDKVIVLKEK